MQVDHTRGFEAVVETITFAPATDQATGDLPLAEVVGALARAIGQAQLAIDAEAADGMPDTDRLAAGALPPCYQITESTVDMNLVLRFPGSEARASYPDLGAPPGAVSTVRVVLRPVAPTGIVLPPPAEPSAVRIMAD
ncbi:hypothetical protein [Umezawaea tangerina]|uniref:Uncharacterized protein n=1 Tax=Umezawaea tangerina TaxID=84725 RepID=A0A2T0T284_9PSEU|nr:hypothetical protein [Umezawaea tangerina]PRY39743.1 hypothetical protein CLV43_107330 [Umezawaea tangerina]